MQAGTSEDKTKYLSRHRIVVILDTDRAGELLDMLVGAGARIDLAQFVSPMQVAYIDRIMQNDNYYAPQ